MTTRKAPVQGVEIHDDHPTVDPVTASSDLSQIVADEAFMNEMVTVLVHSTTDENQAPHLIVNCNGINMPIMRGVPTIMKRKYLEILARMKETKYTQVTPNPAAPDVSELRARHGLAYPFEVQHDANPRGREWLAHILAEPA